MIQAYAVKLGTYVELRICKTPLQAKISKITRSTFVKEQRIVENEAGNFVIKTTPVKKDFVLKQVFYMGGKVVRVLSLDSYHTLTHKYSWPSFGSKGAVLLPHNVTNRLWRKSNL